MHSTMLRNGAVPSRILCRVDVEDTVWILIKYETAKETSWLRFKSVKEMHAYVSQPQINLECPQRRLTPEESNKMIGDERRKMQVKIQGLENELRRYKTLVGEGPKAPSSLHTSPAVSTNAAITHRVTTGTVQSSGGSSSGSGAVRPIETRHSANFPANLAGKFDKVSGVKRTASALLNVPGSGSSGSGLGSGNNSEAESVARKIARVPTLLRDASSASINSTASTSAAPVSKTQDLRSMLRDRQSRVPSLSSLAPDDSENDPLNTSTGTANSSLNNTPRGAEPIKSFNGKSALSEDEGSYYWTESEGSVCERHRHKDLEGGMSTDDGGYHSENSTTSHGSTFAASKLATTTSGTNNSQGGNDKKASSAKRTGIAMKDETSRDFMENTTTNAAPTTEGTGRSNNKHSLRRSQSVESNNSVNSSHSANSNHSHQSVQSVQSNHSANSQTSRASRRSTAHASHTASPAQSNTFNNNNSNNNFNNNFNNLEDDSRCSMRLSQDDEESRSLLFAGLQDHSRTFTYPGKNSHANNNNSSSSNSSAAPFMSTTGVGGTGGGLFGMVMSYASNYMANFLSPSQKERERLQREQQALPQQTTTSATAASTSSSHTNNNNNHATEAGQLDTELSQSSQARSNDSYTMLEYTRDAAPSTYSSSNTVSHLPVANADVSTTPALMFDPDRMEEDGDTQESTIVGLAAGAAVTEKEEKEIELIVPVDWTRISVEVQKSLAVFTDAIRKAKLSPAMESTLLRGIVTKEINPIECGRLLGSNLRARTVSGKSTTTATRSTLPKEQSKVLAKVSKLLQKLSLRNKKIPMSVPVNVKTVCACCIVQVSLQMHYYHLSEKQERTQDNKQYSETVSDSLDRLVFVLNSLDVSNDDAAWLLAFPESVNTRAASHTRSAESSVSVAATAVGSPPEQEKPRIEVFIEYLKGYFTDSVIWPDVQDAVLRYDSTYRRNFISPVKNTPASVKKSKKATAQKAVTELASSGTLFDIMDSASATNQVGSFQPSVLPPRGRADSGQSTSVASTDKQSAENSAPVVAPLKRTNSVLSGLLLKQVQAKVRGASAEPNVPSKITNDTDTAAEPAEVAPPAAVAPTGRVKRLVLERKTRPTHRDMMEQKTVTVSHKPSVKPAYTAPVAAPPAPKPAPVTSLFMASEFAKTPNKTRMISFGAHHGLGGHATPISSQMDYEDFSFSTQRGSQRSVLRSTSARRSTVVENTPMENLQARRSRTSSSSARSHTNSNRYFSGGVGYLSSPSPEGTSARRKARSNSHGDLNDPADHADSGMPHSGGSRSSTSSSGGGGLGSAHGGSGSRASRYTNRLSNLFVTQDDNDEETEPLAEDEEEKEQGRTSTRSVEVRAAGAFSDFFSSQEHHIAHDTNGNNRPGAYFTGLDDEDEDM